MPPLWFKRPEACRPLPGAKLELLLSGLDVVPGEWYATLNHRENSGGPASP